MSELISLLLGALLGFGGQWLFYRYQRRTERLQVPNIVLARVVKNDRYLLEIRNLGHDSLHEMDLTISWLHNNQKEQKVLRDFFMPEEDDLLDAPRHIEMLGPSDRYYVAGLPDITDNGIVDVTLEGFGVNSEKQYRLMTQVAVALAGQVK